MPKGRTWIPFREFFARADRAGLARVDAAQALLRNIKARTADDKVRGIFREWEFAEETPAEQRLRYAAQCWQGHLVDLVNEAGGEPTPEQLEAFTRLNEIIHQEREEWRELARPLHAHEVPPTTWGRFEKVSSLGEASWSDDEEDPYWWESLDLIGGVYRSVWYAEQREEWNSLEIDEAFADLIISRPAEIVSPFSTRDLARIAKTFNGNSETFSKMVRDSGRSGNLQLTELRNIWNHMRHRKAIELPGQGKKRGRPRKAG